MRARLELSVLYDAPALDCRRVLRVLPLARPNIIVRAESISVLPPADVQNETSDKWNNRVLVLQHRRIEREFRLSLEASLEAAGEALCFQRRGEWKMPSRAVPFAPELMAIAHSLSSAPPTERAEHFNQLVFQSLEYTSQASAHPNSAATIWKHRRGTCADFAHVLLALCRASGLPARYVAGFGPFPGALHAWVEVGIGGQWRAFDPTHGREAVGLYLPVATGRDFYNCAPHTGTFRGHSAQLELRCELSS